MYFIYNGSVIQNCKWDLSSQSCITCIWISKFICQINVLLFEVFFYCWHLRQHQLWAAQDSARKLNISYTLCFAWVQPIHNDNFYSNHFLSKQLISSEISPWNSFSWSSLEDLNASSLLLACRTTRLRLFFLSSYRMCLENIYPPRVVLSLDKEGSGNLHVKLSKTLESVKAV